MKGFWLRTTTDGKGLANHLLSKLVLLFRKLVYRTAELINQVAREKFHSL